MVKTVLALAFAGLLFATPAFASPEPPAGPPGKVKKQKAEEGWTAGLDLTEEQRAAIRALRQQIDAETVGNNKVVLWFLRQELDQLLGEPGRGEAKGKRKQLDEATRAKAKELKARMAAMRKVIKDGHERYRQGVLALLTEEQLAELERRKAEREARPKGQQPGQKGKGKRQAPGQDRKRYAGVSEDEAEGHGIFWSPRPERKGHKGTRGKQGAAQRP